MLMPTMAMASDTLVDTAATAPTDMVTDMVASTTARGRLRLSLRLRPSPTTTAATATDPDISADTAATAATDTADTSTARGRLMLRPSLSTAKPGTAATLPSTASTTTVSLLPSLPLLEDTLLLVATSPTLLALSTLPKGRLRLRPSPTTTAATAMDSATAATAATAATDTADASTAKLLNPPASGRDQSRLVTGLSAESRLWLIYDVTTPE